MLEIYVKEDEFFNPTTQEFVEIKPVIIKLEHSLISVAKWEAIWEVPFLPTKGKTEGLRGAEQQRSYIECMIIGKTQEHIPYILFQQYSPIIRNYIEKSHSATTIRRRGPKIVSRQVITSEVIYYWMIKYGVPLQCEKWHFNRLLKLLEVCEIKETPAKKNRVSRKEAINEIYRLNAERRAAQNN
jgi:hypothetical protein